MTQRIKRLSLKATKNVMTDAMVDALQDSAYGDMIARNWVEYVSVQPEKPIESLPAEVEDLQRGEEGEFEIYLPANFFSLAFSDKMEKQRGHTYTMVDINASAIEDWLNENLEGVDIRVDRVNREGNERLFYPPDALDDPEAEPSIFEDVTVVGTVNVTKTALRRALRRYKAYLAGNLAGKTNLYAGINPYKRSRRTVKRREFENLYEALQELQVQAGNANLNNATSVMIAEMVADGLITSEYATELGVFIADLEAVASGDVEVNPYQFAAEIAEVLLDYEDVLYDIP